jgi:hypothetical protein
LIKEITNFSSYFIIDRLEVINQSDDPFLFINGLIVRNIDFDNCDAVLIILNTYKYLSYSKIINPINKTLPKRKRNSKGGFQRSIPYKKLPKGRYEIKFQLLNVKKSIIYEFNPKISLIIDNNTVSIIKLYSNDVNNHNLVSP